MVCVDLVFIKYPVGYYNKQVLEGLNLETSQDEDIRNLFNNKQGQCRVRMWIRLSPQDNYLYEDCLKVLQILFELRVAPLECVEDINGKNYMQAIFPAFRS